jgi:Methyltransferase domain
METELGSICSLGTLANMASIARECPPGCFVEVGVYEGGSAQVLYKIAIEQERQIFLYDTFTGIPYEDPGDSHKVGDFKGGDPERLSLILPKAIVVQGIFPASAVDMPAVAFVHLDCDQYRSYRDAMQHLEPMMVPGGVMWFDDYDCTSGATLAVDERYGRAALCRFQDDKFFKRF